MPEIFDLKCEFPMLRTPVSIMIDDWGIGFPSDDRNDFVSEDDFKKSYDFMKDMVMLGEKGIRGKITVLPYTTRKVYDNVYRILGRIDKSIKGVSQEKLVEILKFIRSRVAEYFDLTPEVLTHSMTLDLKKKCLLDETEWEWSQRQGLKTLTKYIAHALEILSNVGIVANGVTSPCNFGMEVEGIYARAALEAEKKVNKIGLTWYFLHVEPTRIGRQASIVKPKLMYLNKEKREAVVSIVSGSADYLGGKYVEDAGLDVFKIADYWISSNGDGGRLVELFKNKAYLIFHTHCWSIYREDKIGIEVLKEVMRRLDRLFGRKILWMKCSEVSRYFTVTKTFRPKVKNGSKTVELIIDPIFSCPYLTISFITTHHVKEIEVNERKIEKVMDGETLYPNSWMVKDNRIYLCFNLSDKTKIKIGF